MCGGRISMTVLVSEEGHLFMEFEGNLQRLIPKDDLITDSEQRSMKCIGELYPDESWGGLLSEDEPFYYKEEDGELVYNDDYE